ncbi:MAG: NADH-quinone oxidoreductase subunit B [Eggerthellaceae bacterium]
MTAAAATAAISRCLPPLTPLYDVERFGIINTGNPKHADIFQSPARSTSRTSGGTGDIRSDGRAESCRGVRICACSAGIFHDCYNIIGGVDKAIPVDVYVPGCAGRPEAIIDGVVQGLAILEEKAKALAEAKKKGE